METLQSTTTENKQWMDLISCLVDNKTGILSPEY